MRLHDKLSEQQRGRWANPETRRALILSLPHVRRAMERHGLTFEELDVWRAIKKKTRMSAAEAAEVVKNSRKPPA